MPKPNFAEQPPPEPSNTEHVRAIADAYLLGAYIECDIEHQAEAISMLFNAGERETATKLIIEDFQTGFVLGAIAQALNPDLFHELDRGTNTTEAE